MAQATGVQTNGIGRTTTAHLNLTATLAEADRDDFIRHNNARLSRRIPAPESKGIAFAGKDK